jgi:hypothetical protein
MYLAGEFLNRYYLENTKLCLAVDELSCELRTLSPDRREKFFMRQITNNFNRYNTLNTEEILNHSIVESIITLAVLIL